MLRNRTALSSHATRLWFVCLYFTCLCFAGGFVSLGEFVAYADEEAGWTQALEDAGIDGKLESLPYPRSYTVHQVSSYDRTGGANDNAYAHETFGNGRVLADISGPGAILRVYVENPTGTLLVFIDDMQHPITARQFHEIFSGELELFSPSFALLSPPFTGAGSGGFYSYVPIPFKERCRIVMMGEGETLNYQVTHASFPATTLIKSFELTLNKDDLKYFRNWNDAWTSLGVRRHDLDTEELHKSGGKVWPNSNSLVYPIEGPGVITEIEFILDSFDPAFTDNIWIAVYFDGQSDPGVLAPVGDFFGRTATAAANHNGVVVGNVDGRMWCRYPMPFREYAEIRVINTADTMADFKYNITWRPGDVHNQQYFFARYNSATVVDGQAYRLAELSGAGHFAGASIGVSGAADLKFLEGDDMISVDGRPASDFHGTATDSFFNSGGYFASGPYSAATHACTVKVGSVPTRIGATRTFVTDVVPFSSSLTFDLEHGNGNNQPGLQYESVAYWYQVHNAAPLWMAPEVSHAPGVQR